MITDDIIDNIEILSKLELSVDERITVKKDMEKMLGFIDKMNELDTKNIEPLTHITDINNVYREDVVVNDDDRENMLLNAPDKENDFYKVPKTI